MQRFVLFLTLAVLLLAGCGGSAATSAAPPTEAPPPPSTETPVPPTDTPLPPPTDTLLPPTPTVSPFPFRDDFDGALAEGWNWLVEYPTHWNLTDVPGFLRIIAQNTNMGSEEPKNLLLREALEGNFQISTYLQFTPTSNFQFAGLLIYDEPGSGRAMQFGRAFADCGGGTMCIGNAIYFDITEPGKSNFATDVPSDSQAYLRLVREGNTYSGYYSEDGIEWTLIGQHESSTIAPLYVGLIASQAYEAEVPADFDYFTIEVLP
jgi:beta-xylosidase